MKRGVHGEEEGEGGWGGVGWGGRDRWGSRSDIARKNTSAVCAIRSVEP